jgi:hypothetical protein
MKNQLVIKPRMTGKTTFILEELKKNPNAKVIVAHGEMYRRFVGDNFVNKDQVIFCTNECFVGHVATLTTHLYIDDYFDLPMNIKEKIFNLNEYKTICSTTAFGTPSKQFYTTDITLCRAWWKNKKELGPILKDLDEMVDIYSKELMYNLIVHPDFTYVYSHDPFKYKHLSPEQFQTQILGNIFKD